MYPHPFFPKETTSFVTNKIWPKTEGKWSNLQWTMIGPPSGPTLPRTNRTNLTRDWGFSGVPKSGHAMKWKCFILRTWSPWIVDEKIKTSCLGPRQIHNKETSLECLRKIYDTMPSDSSFSFQCSDGVPTLASLNSVSTNSWLLVSFRIVTWRSP